MIALLHHLAVIIIIDIPTSYYVSSIVYVIHTSIHHVLVLVYPIMHIICSNVVTIIEYHPTNDVSYVVH